MKIIAKRKYLFGFSGLLVLASVASFLVFGLKFGIDFTDGVLMELKFGNQTPANEEVRQLLAPYNLGDLTIQPSEEGMVLIRYVAESDELNETVQQALGEKYSDLSIERIEFTTTATEAKTKAILATILAAAGIVIYIKWAFRKVSYPVESWKYGIAAVLALVHDLIITIGIFALLGKYYGVEVNTPFVAALLTILGYSVNDTIVVFDRIRENLLRAGAKENFEETVDKSINETIARSINTSMTVMLVLLAIFFLGGESIKYFALALFIGVFFGTYSSIFVASAFLVDAWKWQKART